ncbi:hypothetical protein U1Q18_012050 [Sarracenia purpurea var. burkii]
MFGVDVERILLYSVEPRSGCRRGSTLSGPSVDNLLMIKPIPGGFKRSLTFLVHIMKQFWIEGQRFAALGPTIPDLAPNLLLACSFCSVMPEL